MKTERIVITGATGLIGRNLLFEIIKQNMAALDNWEIIILGRGKNEESLEKRISDIINLDGIDYFGNVIKRKDDLNIIKKKCLQYIVCNFKCIRDGD